MFSRLAGALYLCLVLCNCTGMDTALRLYGYIPLTPPSRLLKPGAVVFRKKGRRFEVGIVCTPEQSLGPNFEPLESDTVPTFIEDNLNKEFDLDVETLNRLAGGAGSSTTKKVTIKLDHAKLFEINDWIVATYVSERSPTCTRMIKERQAAGYEITMVTSALVADASYDVEWADNGRVKAEAKALTLEALAGKVTGLLKNSKQNKFEAENMVWGVRTDSFLASMSLPQN